MYRERERAGRRKRQIEKGKEIERLRESSRDTLLYIERQRARESGKERERKSKKMRMTV